MHAICIRLLMTIGCFAGLVTPGHSQNWLTEPAPPRANLSAPQAKSFALVIGNDDYENWTKLRRAVSDARLVADTLEKQQGFQVTRKFNLKGDALRDAMRDFFAEKGHDAEARLFLWYAGHSTTIEVRGEKIGYLLPTDSPKSTSDAKFKSVALPMDGVLYDYVRATNARHVLVVFDSCFAGIVLSRGAAAPAAPMQHWKNPVHHYIAAGTAKQSVFDDGVFARLFVNAVTGRSRVANANRDGYLTGSELGEYLVSEAGRRNGEEQTPVHRKLVYKNAEVQAGEFLFLLDAKATSLGIFSGPVGPSMSEIANNCVTRPRHASGEAISKRLAAIANVQANTLEHKLKDGSGGSALAFNPSQCARRQSASRWGAPVLRRGRRADPRAGHPGCGWLSRE